jgi:hypothetical protein
MTYNTQDAPTPLGTETLTGDLERIVNRLEQAISRLDDMHSIVYGPTPRAMAKEAEKPSTSLRFYVSEAHRVLGVLEASIDRLRTGL